MHRSRIAGYTLFLLVLLSLTGCFTSRVIDKHRLDKTVSKSVYEWEEIVRIGDDLHLQFKTLENPSKKAITQHASIENITHTYVVRNLKPDLGPLPEYVLNNGNFISFTDRRCISCFYPRIYPQNSPLIYGEASDPIMDIVVYDKVNILRQRTIQVSGFYQVPNPSADTNFYLSLPLAVLADIVTSPIQLIGAIVLGISLSSGDLKVTGI